MVQENKYNGEGQRVEKTENGITHHYHYEEGMLSYVTNAENSKTIQYLAIGNDVIASAKSMEENTYLYNTDIQNSTMSLLDKMGDGTTRYDYDDFGETKESGADDTENEICYTGGVYDRNTGLYYLNARYYNPEDGRFLTQDTYRGESNEPDTYHLYAYCKNNPINYADPSGHEYTRCWEMAYGSYWYDKKNHQLYGKNGNSRMAKSKSDKNLSKYKKEINKERGNAMNAQKYFGHAAIKAIIDYGIFKVSGLLDGIKMSRVIPAYILSKIKGAIANFIDMTKCRIIGSSALDDARKGINYLKKCRNNHNSMKTYYKKIKHTS